MPILYVDDADGIASVPSYDSFRERNEGFNE